MKLDASALRYLSRDHFRVLTAVEMGMKNHDLVPVELLARIANLRHGGIRKFISDLMRHKLLHHEGKVYDGYRLTYLGYDYLALKVFVARGLIAGVGRQIGVGKESDIYLVNDDEGRRYCLKVHRLGRTSFRAIKKKRDYHSGKGSPSWLYLSRIAAAKEFAWMKMLRENKYPVPVPVDSNRHCILMQLVDGTTMTQVRQMGDDIVENTYDYLMRLLERLGRNGLIHGDYNEYNLMMSDKGKITLIDFPQMMSMDHPNAKVYFDRDVQCIVRLFRKRFNYVRDDEDALPSFEKIVAEMSDKRLDNEAKTHFKREKLDADVLEKALEAMQLEEAQACSDAEESGSDAGGASDAADNGATDDESDSEEAAESNEGVEQGSRRKKKAKSKNVKRRVQKEITDRRNRRRKGKTSRNTIKNRGRRNVAQAIRDS